MLTLTVTDPSTLTTAERVALLAFASAICTPERIAPEDRPDTGLDAPLGEAMAKRAAGLVPMPAPTPATLLANDVQSSLDAAKIFGAADSAASAAAPTPPVPAAPAAAPSAPSATPVASGPPAGGKTLDASGLPWDHRIHAATKTLKQDGKWTKKKNVEAATIVTVEAELRALLAVPAPAGMPLPPGLLRPPTFADLMGWITTEIAALRLTQVDVVAAVQPLGLSSVVGLDARPDLIPQVRAALEATLAGRVPTP